MASRSPQLHTIALFDVDSASIGVSVLAYEAGNPLPVREYFSHRKQLKHRPEFDEFFAHTLRTLEEVANEALHHAPSIKKSYLILGTPWMSSQKRIARYARKTPFTVTPELVRSVIEKETQDPLTKNTDYAAYTDLVIFERRTIDLYINGYASYEPFKKKTPATELEIHSLTSVMSSTTKDAFTHTIERVFHQQPDLISNAFVSYHMHKTFFPHDDSALVIDVGGVTTQLYVIHDDHLVSLASFPVGRHHLIDALKEHASVDNKKAQSLFRMYTEASLDDTYRTELTNIMRDIYRVWMKPLYTVCDELSRKKLLPGTISLIAPLDIRSWLRFHLLETDELGTHMHTTATPRVIDVAPVLSAFAKERNQAVLSDEEMIPIADAIGTLLTESYETTRK